MDLPAMQAMLSKVSWSDTFTEAVDELTRGLIHYGEFREAVVLEMGSGHDAPADQEIFAAILEDIDRALDECAGINMLHEQNYNMVYHTSSRTVYPWWMD